MGKKLTKTPSAAAPILPLKLLFLLAPFAAGLFYEPLSALASLVLLGYLGWLSARNGGLTLTNAPVLLSTAALAVFYLLSPLWAVDHGMAILGFVKFLPLPLFAAACLQLSSKSRRELLELLLWGGAAMTLLSGLLALIPAAREYVLVSGRLAGFFQYPNAFAAYVLLGAAVLLGRETWRVRDAACLFVLLAGLALSGSRTVMVLLVLLAAASFFLVKDKRRCAIFAGITAAALVGGALLSGSADAVSAAGRALEGGAGSSTFFGRLLYYRDALPVILRHPLGLGYMGYYYLQGSFQTGVYTVMHIHNDLLQFLLDVGWIPAALLVWAVIRGFLDKSCDLTRRLVIVLCVAHALFDFDLQFIAMDFILVLALLPEGGKTFRVRRPGVLVPACVLAALCLYFGAASALYHLNAKSAAVSLYPGYTQAWLDLLPETRDAEEMERVADEILARNDAVSLAHSAKARAAYAEGDFGTMIEEKRKAISLAKYDLSTYLDYFDMLSVGVRLYAEADDADSAEYCRQCLLQIPEMLQDALDGTSALGRRIADRPALELPAEYAAALEALR